MCDERNKKCAKEMQCALLLHSVRVVSPIVYLVCIKLSMQDTRIHWTEITQCKYKWNEISWSLTIEKSKKINASIDQNFQRLKIETSLLKEFSFEQSNHIHAMRFILILDIFCNCGMCIVHEIFHQKTNAWQTFQGCHLNVPTVQEVYNCNRNLCQKNTEYDQEKMTRKQSDE